MIDDRDPYERLLSSLADDTPADWDEAHRALGSRAEPLRDLSRIAAFHRGLQRGAAVDDVPAEWGTLTLLERIGRGARSEVWRAWDRTLRREVALKLLRGGASGPIAAGASEAALLDEARAAARVSHPNVVVVHGVARHGDHAGLWMEYVGGASLATTVKDAGPLAPREAAALAADLASALAALHAAGVCHRDLKPANVLRAENGRWVLADFGLGLSRDVRASFAPSAAGTPMYLAPELFRGEPHTGASDQYALALTAWFAMTGRDAFAAGTFEERATLAARPEPPRLRDALPGADPALAAILERALAHDPAARFASAAAFEQALRGWIARGGKRPHPIAWAAVTIAVLAVAAAAWNAARERTPVTVAPGAAAPAPPATPVSGGYAVSATFARRGADAREPLGDGARVKPGDRLSLDVHVTRPAHVYVLNEDDNGERYLLFPQPLFDQRNPVAANTTVTLPGTVGGVENAWTVTSRGGRERFLVVVSPEPVAELEAELSRLPAPRPGRPITYASVPTGAIERLRGVGGVATLSPRERAAPGSAGAFDQFRALAGRETDVRGVWVRQIVLENPR
ncbi:MAG: protein kinase [Candidatus Eisenbacteria bacterium]|uniref:Protein kinase n=1 Tax=Eiseniibacteriota bacterium TaxID=2212470 RepID=A0A933SJQ4_UNCEI|nr:protein kinase [Candidatus Eisenbacteria bacterium]